MPTKVHELLAVYANLTGQATKLRTDLASTFDKKRHLFERKIITFYPSAEGAQTQEVEQQSDLQTTVHKELEWIRKTLAKAVDVNYQIDQGNREAKADVVTEEGDTLLKDVPATSLLWLEKRVSEWKDLLDAVPTLDPAKGFKLDEPQGKGIHVARDVTKQRTKKMKKVYVKYAATKEHPAQTELVDEDVPVGKTVSQEWSSMLTPALKSDLLERAEILLRAVQKARSKANEHSLEVKDMKIGDTLLDFVLKPLES